jgi:hypothetical protein
MSDSKQSKGSPSEPSKPPQVQEDTGRASKTKQPLFEWIEKRAYLGPKDPPAEPTADQQITPPPKPAQSQPEGGRQPGDGDAPGTGA